MQIIVSCHQRVVIWDNKMNFIGLHSHINIFKKKTYGYIENLDFGLLLVIADSVPLKDPCIIYKLKACER